MWAGFDSTTKTNWNNAGAYEGLTGWKEFLKDTAIRREWWYRLRNTADRPTMCRAYDCAKSCHWIYYSTTTPKQLLCSKKVRGTKSQYNLKTVAEFISCSFTIGISYRASLSASGGTPRARYYVEVYSHYQGLEITTPLEIDFNLDGNWHVASNTLTGVIGVVRGYTAFLQIENARGDVYFDNVRMEHSRRTGRATHIVIISM